MDFGLDIWIYLAFTSRNYKQLQHSEIYYNNSTKNKIFKVCLLDVAW
jgi:hypothetical protein